MCELKLLFLIMITKIDIVLIQINLIGRQSLYAFLCDHASCPLRCSMGNERGLNERILNPTSSYIFLTLGSKLLITGKKSLFLSVYDVQSTCLLYSI